MPPKSTKTTRGKSKAEEPDWYTTPQGSKQTQREFGRALKAGTLARSAGSKIKRSDPKFLEQLMEQAKRSATRSISIRVPITELEEAQRIAEKIGVGYQTVIKQAIREGLRRAG
jgi:hypothetical protein